MNAKTKTDPGATPTEQLDAVCAAIAAGRRELAALCARANQLYTACGVDVVAPGRRELGQEPEPLAQHPAVDFGAMQAAAERAEARVAGVSVDELRERKRQAEERASATREREEETFRLHNPPIPLARIPRGVSSI